MERTARRQRVSPLLAVAGLAVVEILLLTVETIAAPAARETIVGSVLGVAGSPVTVAVRLLFFGLAAAIVIPRLIPTAFAVVTTRLSFRLLAAVITVGTATVFGTLIGGAASTPQAVLIAITVGAVAITTAYVAILVYWRGVDLDSAVSTLERRIGGSDGDDPGRATTCLYAGVGLGTGLTLAGLLLAVGGRLYPLPELLAIGWPIGVVVAARINWQPDPRDRIANTLEIISIVRRSEKGVPTLTLVSLGMGVPATILLVGLPVYTRRLLVGDTVSVAEPVLAWAVVGMVGGIAAACLYALWFWARVFRRLPVFLTAWHEAAGVDTLGEQPTDELVARPAWLLVPFALVITHAIVLIQIGDVTDFRFYGAADAILSLYGLVWPLSAAVIGLAVYWTMRRTPQPPLSATYAIPVATIVEFGSLYVGWGLAATVVRSGGLTAAELVRFPGGTFVLLVLALLVLLFFGPDIGLRLSDSPARRLPLSYLPLGGMLLLFAVFDLHGYRLAWGMMAGLLIAGSLSEVWKHGSGDRRQQSDR